MKTVKAAGQLSPRSAQRDEHCRTGCARSLERGTLAYKISPMHQGRSPTATP